MKKIFLYLCALLMGVLCFCSCSSDDDDSPKLASSLLRVSNATYQEGNFPAATSASELTNVSISDVESNGATTLKVPADKDFVRYFIGVKNVAGYYVFTPEGTRASDDDEEYFDISLMLTNTKSSTTLMVSAETTDGSITKPYEQTINYSTSGEGKGRLKSVVMKDEDSKCEFSFSYDASGRITNASWALIYDGSVEENEDIAYTWPSSLINSQFKAVWSTYNEEYDTTYYKTNNRGYVVDINVQEQDNIDNDGNFYQHVQYDSDGHIVSIKDDEDGIVARYSWNNGNIVRIEEDSDETGDETLRFEYSAIPNPNLPVSALSLMGGELDETGLLFSMGVLGVPCKNLPSKISTGDGTVTFSYTMKSDGTIDNVKVEWDDEEGEIAGGTYYFYY